MINPIPKGKGQDLISNAITWPVTEIVILEGVQSDALSPPRLHRFGRERGIQR